MMKKTIIISILFLLVVWGIFSWITIYRYIEKPLGKEAIPTNEDNMYMVSHSEYWSNEDGQIITRLLNYRGSPITAVCTVDILYPNKTYFVQAENMTFNIDSYYYLFTTPAIEGVYEYKATCLYNNNTQTRSVMNSFHLSPALNFINISHTDLSSRLINLTDLSNAHFGNLSYNLTQIKEDTDYIRANLQTNQSTQDILDQLTSIEAFCNDTVTSGSNLCLWVEETKNRLIAINVSFSGYLEGLNQPPSVNIVSISPTNVLLNGGLDITIKWIAVDANLQNYHMNITYPNGTLLRQTNDFLAIVDHTELNANGTYNIVAWGIDTDRNEVTTTGSFSVVSGVTIINLRVGSPCSNVCQVNFTLIDANNTSIDITAVDWILLEGNFPVQNSSVLATGLTSSPTGIDHILYVNSYNELGRAIYPGSRIRLGILNAESYSNYFLVDNAMTVEDVWNYNGRYIHGETN